MLFRITCTTKTAHHDRIATVGCINESGVLETFTEQQAIKLIEAGFAHFYVERPDHHRVAVLVHKEANGTKFLKTEADGEKPNNLISLPHCKPSPSPIPPPRVVTPARSHGTK